MIVRLAREGCTGNAHHTRSDAPPPICKHRGVNRRIGFAKVVFAEDHLATPDVLEMLDVRLLAATQQGEQSRDTEPDGQQALTEIVRSLHLAVARRRRAVNMAHASICTLQWCGCAVLVGGGVAPLAGGSAENAPEEANPSFLDILALAAPIHEGGRKGGSRCTRRKH